MSFLNKQGVVDRLETAAKARSEMLARFRARPSADDPAVLARQSARRAVVDAREARAAERAAQRQAEIERAAALAEAERLAEIERKHAAGQEDLSGELSEGVLILRDAAKGATGAAAARILEAADALEGPGATPEVALDPDLAAILAAHPDRAEQAVGETLLIQVDPVLARFGSWYELFPRSYGGLRGTAEQVPGSPSWASTSSTCRRSTRSA